MIYGNAFFLIWSEQTVADIVTYLLRWQYTVKIHVWVIYYIHTGSGDWQPHILLKTLDSSALGHAGAQPTQGR